MKRLPDAPVTPRAERAADQKARAEAADWIARHDAGLGESEVRQFAEWLEQPANRAAWQQAQRLWQTLDRPLRTGSADILLGELQARTVRHRRRLNRVAATAAVLLLAATAGWQFRPRPAVEALASSTKAVLLLPSVRSLPDGSVIELGDDADFTVEFSPEFRRVILRRGEAHFHVARNPARPFIVAARGVEVRAVGTAFVVQLGTDDLEVVVTEGRVAVDSAPTAASPRLATPPDSPATTLATVDAGNGVAVRRSAAGHTIRPLSDSELARHGAWRRPRLEFSGTPLVEAAALMNRHNPVQIRFEDPEVARLRVSGIFGAEDTEAFVRLLENTFDLRVAHRSANEIVLRRAP